MRKSAWAAAALFACLAPQGASGQTEIDFSRYMRQSSSLTAIATALSILDCRVPVEYEEKTDAEALSVELTAFCPEVDNEAGATIRFHLVDDFLIPDGFSFFP